MIIATLVAAGSLFAVAGLAHAGTSLDAVKKERLCAMRDGLPGFSYCRRAGIDVDVCRSVAAAVFGNATKVKYTPLNAKELDGATVYIQAGTDTELSVADYFKANNMKYTPVTFDRSDESAKALESGRCDTLASDRVIFMDRGEIVEQAAPDEFFAHPKSERTCAFLSQVIH